MIRYILLAISLLTLQQTQAQTPILLDGVIDDWETVPLRYIDIPNDHTQADFLEMAITNDDQYLYIKLELGTEIHLSEDNNVIIYLDVDASAETGYPINGIGGDWVIEMDQLEARRYDTNGGTSESTGLNRMGVMNMPSVSSRIHELAIPLTARGWLGTALFPRPSFQIVITDGERFFEGDMMPNEGESFSYVIEEKAPIAVPSITLEKEANNHVRLMSFNTEQDGLLSNGRLSAFERIIKAVQPDIITFNECWDTSPSKVEDLLNRWMPDTQEGWFADKEDPGNITASRFRILESWDITRDGRRLTASLIELPSGVGEQLLVVNAHLKCCAGDDRRQEEADAFIDFILDAKTTGGRIDIPEGTPIVLSGDLNLVGSSRPLTTLLTGEIFNTNIWGEGAAPDWDGTGFEDLISRHTDRWLTYTWRRESSYYTPGRIDFFIYSNSVMQIEKAYTLDTETLPQEKLEQYGLRSTDNERASDHLPKVTDFTVVPLTTTTNNPIIENPAISLLPNPVQDELYLQFENEGEQATSYQLFDMQGRKIKEGQLNPNSIKSIVSVGDLPTGLYFFKLVNEKQAILYSTKIVVE